MSILETPKNGVNVTMSICLWLLVTGQSQLQPQQLRIFVEAHFLQSKFRAIEEARIPGNDVVRKSSLVSWKMPKNHEVKNKELDTKTCLPITKSKVSLPTPLPNTLQSGLSDVPGWTEQLSAFRNFVSWNLPALRLCSFSKDRSTCSGRTRHPKS